MDMRFTGCAWVFGNDVTTDDILPGQYLDRSNEETGAFALSGIDPDFTSRIRKGDIIVAGTNFGAGSGRESAVFAIKYAGIPVVIAESFARIFLRNAVNNGLIPVILDSTARLKQGDSICVDVQRRQVTNLTTQEVFVIRNLTGISRGILEAGGIMPYTQRRIEEKRNRLSLEPLKSDSL